MGTAHQGRGEFAVRLRHLREAASLTQEELAARAGLTGKAVGALERGERRRPYPHTVRALADALGIDAQERAGLAEAARSPEPPATTAEEPRAQPALRSGPTPLVGRDADVTAVLRALLTADEQALLRRLSVFADTFTLDAAEAVAGDGLDVFAALSGLADQSLVVGAAEPDTHRLLELVRQYAAARLGASGERSRTEEQHAAWYTALGRAARPGLRGADQARWLDQLGREHGNLRLALATLLDRPGCRDAAGLLLADTWLYWALRGAAGEAVTWAENVLAGRPDDAPTLLALAGLRSATGDVTGVVRAAAAAKAGFAAHAEEAARLGEALMLEGTGAMFAGDLAAAADALAGAEEIGRGLPDRWVLAHAITARAQCLLRSGDVAAARSPLEEAEAIARELASPFTLPCCSTSAHRSRWPRTTTRRRSPGSPRPRSSRPTSARRGRWSTRCPASPSSPRGGGSR